MTLFRRKGANDGIMHTAFAIGSLFPLLSRVTIENEVKVIPGEREGYCGQLMSKEEFEQKYEPAAEV